jgi:hypothetical protein
MTSALCIRIIVAVCANSFVRAERSIRPMLRIEKESDGHTTILRLVGRIQSVNIGNIRAQMDDGNVPILMDLDEVTLVNVEVVRFLSNCEDEGIVLLHCPLYIREWILRERAEGTQSQVPDGT